MPVGAAGAETGNGAVGLRRAVVDAAAGLAAAGVASPRVDAEFLAAHVLGIDRGRLALVAALSADQAERYRDLVARRALRVPLQHLTGSAPFRWLDLAVGPGVFIPRPETELLVEWGLAGLGGRPVVVDLCSGSGAVAIAVAQECPDAEVYAVELDRAALTWLTGNVAAHGRGRVTVVAGDAGAPRVLADLDGRVDLVLCNPPYVPDATVVEPEVAGHDPALAVFGGPDGLTVIRRVVDRAAGLLRAGGRVGIEHDDSHDQAVVDLLCAHGGYRAAAAHRDLAGRPRFATAVRRDAAGTALADLPL